MTRKRYLTFLLKGVISFGILAFLLIFKTSIKDIAEVLKGVNLFWLAVSFSLHFLGLLISAYRWQILAQAQGDHIPLGFLAKSYLVGTFFNNFLPSRFGGDVVRIWDGSRFSRSLVKSSAIVLVERLTGIIILFIFAFLASLFRLDMAQKIPVIWVSLLLGLAGLAFAVFFFLPGAGRLIENIPEKGFLGKAKHKVIAFRMTILGYREKKPEFFRATLWAFLLQLNVILYYFLIGQALHLKVSLLDYFIFIPIVLLIQIIPVTINGLGLREGSYIEVFKFYGIAPPTAISFSFIEVSFGLLIGIAGGIIYVLRK
ncbi:MAG: lysylphosphatidylglycerol synthase transmembrane domain-containing protein [Candidatus Aminicenantales bacterium]